MGKISLKTTEGNVEACVLSTNTASIPMHPYILMKSFVPKIVSFLLNNVFCCRQQTERKKKPNWF